MSVWWLKRYLSKLLQGSVRDFKKQLEESLRGERELA